jgi:hypothetical protein
VVRIGRVRAVWRTGGRFWPILPPFAAWIAPERRSWPGQSLRPYGGPGRDRLRPYARHEPRATPRRMRGLLRRRVARPAHCDAPMPHYTVKG